MNRKRLMTFGLGGAAFTALCCFTPILVGLLGLVGLGAVIGYLDYVLLPALVVFLGVTVYAVSRKRQTMGATCCATHDPDIRER